MPKAAGKPTTLRLVQPQGVAAPAVPGLAPRPQPPQDLPRFFAPAPDMRAWIEATFIAEEGALHNPDHTHLQGGDADFEVLWAAEGFVKQQRQVLGMTEQIMFRVSGWARLKQEIQLMDWFQRVPGFVITLDADFCRNADDADFCALVEHELYHIGQARDQYGAPAFLKSGAPKLAMRGHDVEEFVGVVQRYGVGPSDSALARLVTAGAGSPMFSRLHVASACGTCIERAA